MTAYLISTITIRDKEKLTQYSTEAGKTLAAFGGTIALRGMRAQALSGDFPGQMSGVISFADMAALTAWYTSDAYQALIPLRDQGCEMSMVAYEAMA